MKITPQLLLAIGFQDRGYGSYRLGGFSVHEADGLWTFGDNGRIVEDFEELFQLVFEDGLEQGRAEARDEMMDHLQGRDQR